MSNAVTVQQAQPLAPVVDEKTVRDFLFTSGTKLTEKQQNMFLQMSVRNNLDPFKREIYAIAYGSEFSIVTGYQTYISRAEATGNLNGWECTNTEAGAKCTIWRKDQDHPFVWEADYDEWDKGIALWKKSRKFMIKKVCICQAFRLCFPNDLGGLPYAQEEMEGAKPFSEKSAAKPKTRKYIPKMPPEVVKDEPSELDKALDKKVDEIVPDQTVPFDDEPPKPPKEGKPISDKQVKLLFAKLMGRGIEKDEAMKDFRALLDAMGYDTTVDKYMTTIVKDDMNKILEWINGYGTEA